MGKNPVMRKAMADFKKGIITKAELDAFNAAEADKLFPEGTNKALLDIQKESAIKSAKLSQPEIIATDKRLLSRLAELQAAYKKSFVRQKKLRHKLILGCRRAAESGGRIGFAAGTLDACVNTKLTNETPVQSSMRLRAGEGIGKIRSAATNFLKLVGRVGTKAAPLAALAVAGAAIEPLVKQFVADDPTTYLTNEGQMKGMLLATIEGETPKVDEEILKWQYPGLGAATLAGAVPGAGELYKTRRGVGPTGPIPGVGKARAALGLSGVLGKALGASFSPLAAAATLTYKCSSSKKRRNRVGRYCNGSWKLDGTCIRFFWC